MDTWRRLSPSHAVAVPRRRTLLAIALCAIVAVGALVLSRAWNAPRGNGPCADLDLHESRLERAEPLGLPDGEGGNVWLCLAYAPEQDIYAVMFTPVKTMEELRAAKPIAARRLQATGFDPCLVTAWGSSSAGIHPSFEELFDSPVECPPKVIAGDAAAEQWRPDVLTVAGRVADASWRDLGWHPSRPVTIIVVTGVASAMAAYRRYILASYGGSPEWLAERVRGYEHLAQAGVSSFYSSTYAGSVILLNLSSPLRWDSSPQVVRAALARTVAHEYTHFAQRSILGQGVLPAWFEEGQAAYWSQQFMGGTYDSLLNYETPGSVPPRLSQLVGDVDWSTQEHPAPESDPHRRGYGAVAYLSARYGFPATLRLLHDNRDGSLEHFNELLTDLTGMDVDALDDALNAWLDEPGRAILRDDFSVPSGYWPGGADAKARFGYQGGEYSLAKLDGTHQSAVLFPVLAPGDYKVEVDARVMPPMGGAQVGVEFTIPSLAGDYRYLVEPTEGTFLLERHVGNVWAPIIEWTQATAIRRGLAVNRLSVRATRAEIVLHANGEEIARVAVGPDDPGAGFGFIMAIVDQRDDGEAEARFSRLVVANAR
jgi:hypothetical protein